MKIERNRLISIVLLSVLVLNLIIQPSFAEIQSKENIKTVLYQDGTLVINDDMTAESSRHGQVKEIYDSIYKGFGSPEEIPWKNRADEINRIETGTETKAVSTTYWFSFLSELRSVCLDKLDLSEAEDISNMFSYSGEKAYEGNFVLKIPENCKAEDVFFNSVTEAYGKIEKPGEKERMFLYCEEVYDIEPPPIQTVLYEDSTLVINEEFSMREENQRSHGTVLKTYEEVKGGFSCRNEIPWRNEASHIKYVETGSRTEIYDASYMFADLIWAEEICISNMCLSECRNYTSMFENCGRNNCLITDMYYSSETDSFEKENRFVIMDRAVTDNMFKNAKTDCYLSIAEIPESCENMFFYEESEKYRNIQCETFSIEVEQWFDSMYNHNVMPEQAEFNMYPVTYAASSATVESNRYDVCVKGGRIGWGNTYICTLKADSGGKLTGACCQPNNGSLAGNGTKVSLSLYSSGSLAAKVAYEGTKMWGASDHNKYVVSRALAIAAGYIGKGQYQAAEEVEMLVKRARSVTVPDTFEVYLGKPSGGQQHIVAWRTVPGYCYLQVKKSNADPSGPFKDLSPEGAVYKVYKWNSDAVSEINEVATLTTDKSGYTSTVTLPPRSGDVCYYVKEVKAPPGFRKDPVIHSHYFPHKSAYTFKLSDVPLNCNINIKKINGDTSGNTDGLSLAGAQYEIYTERNHAENMTNAVATLVTDSNGWTDTVNLPPRSGNQAYYVREISAPEGFLLDSTIYSHKVADGDNFTFQVKDMPANGYLKLTKMAADSVLFGRFAGYYSLSGAVYGVYSDKACSKEVASLTTSGESLYGGQVKRSDADVIELMQGIYYVKEKKAPRGYRISSDVTEVNITAGETFNLRLSEIPDYAKVDIRKKTESELDLVKQCPSLYNLQGAEYGIYKDPSCTDCITILRMGEQHTGSDGVPYAFSLNSVKVPKGETIYIKELKAPGGYLKNNSVLKLQCNQDHIIADVKERPQIEPFSFRLGKFIKGGMPWTKKYLEGAEYTVKYYNEYYGSEEELSGRTPLRTWVFRTDSNGVIEIDDKWKVGGNELFKKADGTIAALYGTYTFEETRAPDMFFKNRGITIRQVRQNEVTPDIDEHSYGDAVNVASEEPDESITRSITVNKVVSADNYYRPYGEPVFIFKCEGTDLYGNKHVLYKSVTLNNSSLTGNVYKGSVTFDNLPAGCYRISEEETMRYTQKSITDISSNGVIKDNSAVFELVNHDHGQADFINEISRWDNYSDTECVVNNF